MFYSVVIVNFNIYYTLYINHKLNWLILFNRPKQITINSCIFISAVKYKGFVCVCVDKCLLGDANDHLPNITL